MTNTILQIPFKGDRDYLHGTDIFDQVLSNLASTIADKFDNFEISFHSMARKPLMLVTDRKPLNANPVAAGYYDLNGIKNAFWLIETDSEILGRVSFDEDSVVGRMNFSTDEGAYIDGAPHNFSDIEVWIPMVKALHNHLFPDADGKWVFARAKMSAYSHDQTAAKYGVKLASKLGHKLTRNEVFLDDQKVGDIFFSLM